MLRNVFKIKILNPNQAYAIIRIAEDFIITLRFY